MSVGERTMPFGKFKGKTLNEMGQSDDGASYLEWLSKQDWLKDPLKKWVAEFMDGPAEEAPKVDDVNSEECPF